MPWNPPRSGLDSTGMLGILIAGALVLPLTGAGPAHLAFLIGLAMLALAGARCVLAVRRRPDQRIVWTLLAATAALAAVASTIGVIGAFGDLSPTVAFYVGSGASVVLVLGAWSYSWPSLRSAGPEAVVDAPLIALVVGGLGVYFGVRPGFADGDALLATVVLLDLVALIGASLGLAFHRSARDRRAGAWLVSCCLAVVVGDGLASAAAADQIAASPTVTALLWAVAAAALAGAAVSAAGEQDEAKPAEAETRWVAIQILLPLGAVLSFPAIAAALWLSGALDGSAALYFGSFLVLALVLALARQAYLLVNNHRSAVRERELREQVVRRNGDLEALTGLATTMTQTLEEGAIVERGLETLRTAARATSAALHELHPGGTPRLVATAGAWAHEHAWVGSVEGTGELTMRSRGRRDILTLPLTARSGRLGTVTLIRQQGGSFDEEKLHLVALLADELAVAIQNARDYHEKLEQAVRDPLTGLYNRRHFYETVRRELERSRRNGASVSLALLDIDNFKLINDSYGHATGDDVLRTVGATAETHLRPSDSFARVGGEEFALLLPETEELDALLVAERVRTAIAREQLLEDRAVTVSVGVASSDDSAGDLDDLMRKADAALYWVKRNGRNMSAVASEIDVAEEECPPDAVQHLHALVACIDARHHYTRDHSENVAAYALALGKELGLDGEAMVGLRRAALLHDVGKVAVSEHILTKPGRLTDTEFEEMRRHAPIGGEMLARCGLEREGRWVRSHHERLDGGGYPDGLAGEEIPFEARIIFVADAFEAMTSDRSYRRGVEPTVALAELRDCAGTQFDPRVVEAFARVFERGDLEVQAVREPIREGLSEECRARGAAAKADAAAGNEAGPDAVRAAAGSARAGRS